MNSVQLIGRLTKDPVIRYGQGSETPIASFTLAIDGFPRKDGTKHTDFPQVTVFGKQALNCEKYLCKGRLVGVSGRLTTGSYKNKNGDTVYTTEVTASAVHFLEWGEKKEATPQAQQFEAEQFTQAEQARQNINQTLGINAHFENIDNDDIPF